VSESHRSGLRGVRLLLVAAVTLACSLFAATSHAQVLYGSIVGNVKDTSGASIPGATVTVTNKNTALTRDVLTADDGGYNLVNVLPGQYDVKVSLQGFKEFVKTDVPVTAGTVSRVDIGLEVGQLTETVTVASATQLLQTDKADTHTELKAKEIINLPLSGYRNYQSLINLTPGATPAQSQNAAIDTPGRALRTFVNGTAPNNNNTRLDGAVNTNVWLPHHVAYVAPAETIDTVNITTSSFDAEQGMAGGAAMTVVTKSGTNEFKGSAFALHENEGLRAKNYFAQSKLDTSRNIDGATIGGPIMRNKVFFFASWEGTHERIGRFGFTGVPNDALRNGDFSGFNTTIYDPSTGNPDGTGRTAFPGNKIPVERMSPAARRMLDLLPRENTPTGNSLNNYYSTGQQKLDRNNYDVKFNFNRSSSHQLWAKFSMMDAGFNGVFALGEAGGQCLCDGGPGNSDTKQYLVTVGQTWTLSPSMIMDTTFGYTDMDQTVTSPDFGRNYGQDLGIPGTNGTDPRYSGLPSFNFGFGNTINTETNIGNNFTWMPLFRKQGSYTLSNNFTKVKGSHNLRFGVDVVRYTLDHWQPEIANPRGAFTFGGGVTSLNGGTAPNYLNQYAAFLLGLPTATGKSLQYEEMTGREWQFGTYISDRWQVNEKLTLNLGLRWEYYPLMSRADRGIEIVEFAADRPYVLLGGVGGNSEDLGIKVSKTLFAPRLGLAYRINEDSVLRAGYGRTFNPLPWSRPLRGFYPLTIAQSNSGPNAFTPVGSLDQGIPPTATPDLSSGRIPLPNNVNMRYPDVDNVERGHIDSWNLSYERKLFWDLSLNTAYVGTATRGGYAFQDINAGQVPGAGNAGRPLFPQYGRIADTELWGGILESNYHSLQLALNRPFLKGLLVKGSYTFSKAMNMADEDGWQELTWDAVDQFDRNYARAGFDRPHIFSIAMVAELPFGRGDGSRIVNALIRDWQVNGIVSAFSGTPFTIQAANASLNAPGNEQTADQVGDINIIGGIGPNEYWFDPAAFKPVTEARYGTSGRNSVRGPGQWNLDLSFFRAIPFGSRRLEFRVEGFNILNVNHWANPTRNSANPNFGRITSTLNDERQFRLGLRFQF